MVKKKKKFKSDFWVSKETKTISEILIVLRWSLSVCLSADSWENHKSPAVQFNQFIDNVTT